MKNPTDNYVVVETILRRSIRERTLKKRGTTGTHLSVVLPVFEENGWMEANTMPFLNFEFGGLFEGTIHVDSIYLCIFVAKSRFAAIVRTH